MKLLSLIGLIALTTLANAQQVVTLTQSGIGTNSISIAEDQTFEILNITEKYISNARLVVHKDGGSMDFYASEFSARNWGTQNSVATRYPVSMLFSGPAVLELILVTEPTGAFGMASIEISPGQYPPGKSAVIGERDGPMKCTLEESTDLVNWTQSTSGQTHSLTNANAKKFFRIKLEQDVGP